MAGFSTTLFGTAEDESVLPIRVFVIEEEFK